MYIFSFFKALLRPSKILTSIYFILNMGVVFMLFGFFNLFSLPFEGTQAFVYNGLFGLGINFICMLIALSPIGEAYFRFLEGLKIVPENEETEPILKAFSEVYEKARAVNPKISSKVKLYYKESDEINAFALGHRTVAITEGALSLSEEQFKAILAHEFGHISNADSDLTLGIIVSNAILGAFVFVMKLIGLFVALVFSFAREGGFISIIIHFVFVTVLGLVFAIWTKLGMLMMNATSRKDEFRADNYAVKCGMGAELIDALNVIDPSQTRSSALSLLSSTHPDTSVRIEKINEALQVSNAVTI